MQVIHGRSADVVKRFRPGSFDIILTDPPFGIPLMSSVNYQHEDCDDRLPATYAHGGAALNAGHGFLLGDKDEAKTLDTYSWLFDRGRTILTEYGFMYVFLATTMLSRVEKRAEECGWKVRYFAWIKTTVRPPFPGVPWGNGVELLLFLFRKMRMKHRFDPRASAFNWWKGPSVSGKTRVHPTQKPVALLEHLLRRTPGRVLDPFCGSGASLLAAQRLGLDAVGIDEEDRWVKIAQHRLSTDHTNNYK